MYTMTQVDLNKVLGLRLADENSMQERHAEESVQRTLPHMAGLAAASTDAERLDVFKETIACQLKSFVERNGSPFGDVDTPNPETGRNAEKLSYSVAELNFVVA